MNLNSVNKYLELEEVKLRLMGGFGPRVYIIILNILPEWKRNKVNTPSRWL